MGKGDFDAQTRQVFENLRVVLERSGAGFQAIVKVTVYVTDTARLRDYARVKAEYIPGPQPASTAIGVASLALPGDDDRGGGDSSPLAPRPRRWESPRTWTSGYRCGTLPTCCRLGH